MLRLRSPRAKASSAVPSIVAGPITEADVTHTYDWSDFQQERDKEELTDYPHINNCTPEQIEMILLHELAHVRRWDALASLIQRLIECVLFYHPMVWVVSRWVRVERESCCDDIVVQHTKEPGAYAKTLAFVATSQQGLNPTTALAMARHPLVHRIRRILAQDSHSLRFPPILLVCITAVLLTTLAVAIVAAHGENASAAERATNPLVLAFPDDLSLGSVHIRPAGLHAYDTFKNVNQGWEWLGKARGELRVPPGMESRLTVAKEAVEAISPLAQIPDGIDRLVIRSADSKDETLRAIARLHSVKELSLSGPHVTDAGLRQIRRLASLERLTLLTHSLTDSGIVALGPLAPSEIDRPVTQ